MWMKKRRLFLIRKDGKQFRSFGIKRDLDPVTGDASIRLMWPGGMWLIGLCSLIPDLCERI